MKQGNTYTKIILWLFLAAVACYFGFSVFSSVYSPLTTASAIVYEAGTGSYTTGFVVRDESVIRSSYGITTMVVSEGERVSKGQVMATGYRNPDAQARQAEITELENQLAQLEYASAYSGSAADQALLDSEIQSQLLTMCKYAARKDFNSAADRSASLKGLVLRRMSSEEERASMQARIDQLQQQLDSLREDTSGDTMAVTAEHSGYFSGSVDGFEDILTPQSLQTMTLDEFLDIRSRQTPTDSVGKLISGITWYYVTQVPTAQTEGVEPGDTVPVNFASDLYGELLMTVDRLGADEDGSRLLVLSCDSYMQEVTLLRQQSADIVFTSYRGLRVPKEAIRVDDGMQPGVYVLEGRAAVWKPIHILYDNGESYVAELDKTSTENLWPGDEIIVGGKNLYDGKVVR